MKSIAVILSSVFLISCLYGIAQNSDKVVGDDQGLAVNLLFNLNIPCGYIFSPTIYYRSQFRPLNRPIHLFINPNMGMIHKDDADRIDAETGQVAEGPKVKFGFAPEVSIGYPILYKSSYKIARVITGYEQKNANTETEYYSQKMLPTHQALLAEIGYVKYPVYDAFGPSVFYGLRYYLTQKGRIEAEEEGYYYPVKAAMSLYFYFFKRLDSDEAFKDIPADNLRKTGYKFGLEYTKGGNWSMRFSMGGCPGRKDAYGGTSSFLGYFDVGVYKTIGLWKAPL